MITPLTILVHQALPMVYDQSLSFVELLGAVVSKVNELIAEQNAYFDVDLITNVTNILTEWNDDGTLGTIISAALQTEIDDNKAAQDAINATQIITDGAQNAIIANKADKPLAGKKIAVIGDSIAAGIISAALEVTDNNWAHKLELLTGADVTNLAVSGTSMTTYGNPTFDPDSGYNTVIGSSWGLYDYLMIAYGTNDYGNNIPMGTDTANPATFKGAIHGILTYLHTNYPTLKVIMLTPVYGLGQLVRNMGGAGYFREDYTDAIIQVATRYNVPVIDLTHDLGITMYNYSDLYWDGTHHPSEATQNMMGEFIAQVFPGKIGVPNRALLYRGLALQNGATVDGGYPSACFAIDPQQGVHFIGRVTTPATPGAVCFTLPNNAYPPYQMVFPCVKGSGDFGYAIISTNGQVSFDAINTVYALESIAPFNAGKMDVIVPV